MSNTVWDTAGQEKYRTLPSQYFRGIQGVLLVYDLTSATSFTRLRDWLSKVYPFLADRTKFVFGATRAHLSRQQVGLGAEKVGDCS